MISVKFEDGGGIRFWKFSRKLLKNYFHNYQTPKFDADRKQAHWGESLIDKNSLIRALPICELYRE